MKMLENKGFANKQLRYAIAVLQGKEVTCDDKGRLQIALIIKNNLMLEGFWWQASRLENWIHKFQKDRKEVVVGLRRIQR